jgi:predicted lipid-binding transport protein (Tim44 family)
MSNESDKKNLKWYNIRRVRLTGEYCGGLTTGIGAGIMIVPMVTGDHFNNLVFLSGITLALIGDFVAMHAQKRHLQNGL